jgi:hypothetical protein
MGALMPNLKASLNRNANPFAASSPQEVTAD